MMLKKEVNFRRVKWVNDSEKALNEVCPHWLMSYLARLNKVGPRQLAFVKLVLKLYGLEKIDVEKPGVGGLCVISKRGKVVRKIEYEWPNIDEDIFGKPQAIGGGSAELQMPGGQDPLGII